MDDTKPTAPPAAAFDIEKPACFYLGREYDFAKRAVLPDNYVMYDARDLTTHGVVVGMTGSGKTGLSITLLEEAAIDGIPTIILDPKGDLTNLALQFPDFDPRKLEPWLNPEDARQKAVTPARYAEEVAARMRQGLAETAQPPDRVARLSASSEWRIYTPGSEAGLPLSILGAFTAPKGKVPREALTQKIDATATALLGLTGLTPDPVQSREHILLAQLLLHAWGAGRDLDLAGLVLAIQNPPVRTVGAYSLETFFPARERLKFASTLNNVLAAPGFATWTTGEPLDLGSMLYRAGKPQQLIFYIAHLDDTQRMFFTTLLLEEVLNWTRRQPGTSNLRALLYFDEVFGYLPPHPANPPSKQPLLTLLKQARAFGVGILLATQNPVDLDYKALSNAGTWFIGKLQTERDKARLLEGLEGVAAEQGKAMDRGQIDAALSSLGNRVFLMHDIHRPAPVVFQSRWALSLLRGPMTREQVGRLMEPVKQAAPRAIPLCTWCHAELTDATGDRCPNPACGKNPWARAHFRVQDQEFRERLLRAGAPAGLPVTQATAAPEPSANHVQAVLPEDVNQFYVPLASGRPAPAAAEVEYRPYLLAFADVTFLIDKRQGKEHHQLHRLLVRPPAPGYPIAWHEAERIGEHLAPEPLRGARWAGVPDTLDTARKLKALERAFGDYLYSQEKLALYENRTLELVSTPGESEAAFRDRCRQAAGQQATQALEMEKVKFTPRFEALDARLPEENSRVKKGGGLLGWLMPGSSGPEPSDAAAARKQEKVRKLTADYLAKKAEIKEKWDRVGEECTPLQIKPRKADVRVTHFGLAWAPYRRVPGKEDMVPAYV